MISLYWFGFGVTATDALIALYARICVTRDLKSTTYYEAFVQLNFAATEQRWPICIYLTTRYSISTKSLSHFIPRAREGTHPSPHRLQLYWMNCNTLLLKSIAITTIPHVQIAPSLVNSFWITSPVEQAIQCRGNRVTINKAHAD